MDRKTLSTNSGMWALWDYFTYKYINDYGDWADAFEEEEDIVKAIEKKSLVPINIHSDGAFDFIIKYNEELNEREKQYLLVSSNNYLINSLGKLVLSGIEFIDGQINLNDYLSLETQKGLHTVRVNLIDWKREIHALDENNMPTKDALPDFILEVNLIENSTLNCVFSKSIKTF